jgi:hypothetical protein
VGHDDRTGHDVRPPLVQPDETSETPLVAPPGQTYELSLLIRNTAGGGQSLRGCGLRGLSAVLNGNRRESA